MYDIIIIGAGPAGLTAALYARRANKKILILEAKCYGGQIVNVNKIENYPAIASISGFDFATNLYNQVKDLGAEIRYETVLRIEKDKTVITNKNKYTARAIILATGSERKKLKIENEDNLIGKGVSYCATCDGNFYKNKPVAIIGDENDAMEDALYLADLSSKVYFIYSKDNFNNKNINVEELKSKDNVEFIMNSTIERINGTEKLESIDIINNHNEKRNIKISGLFIAVGQEPKNKMFSNLVELDKNGYIISSDGVHTKSKGVYVAGDARVKDLRQLTTAVSDGSIAATTAIKEMN